MITKVFLLAVPYAQKSIKTLTLALKNNLPTSFSRLNCHVTNARVKLEAQRRRGCGWTALAIANASLCNVSLFLCQAFASQGSLLNFGKIFSSPGMRTVNQRCSICSPEQS